MEVPKCTIYENILDRNKDYLDNTAINYFGNKQTGDWVCMPLGIFKDGAIEYLTPNFLDCTDTLLEKYPSNGEKTFTHNYFFVYDKKEVKELIKQLQKLIGE